MAKKIEFPFKPNETVKAAFRNDAKMKIAIKLMTEALAEVAASQCESPFAVLFKEYPELKEQGRSLHYNHVSGLVDIK